MSKVILPNDPVSIITNPNSIIEDLDLSHKTTKDDLYNAGFKDPNAIYNLRHIIEDLLSGDMSVAKREEYAYLNFEQIKKALEWIMTNDFSDNFKNLLLEKPYLLNFKGKPPTPEEFLTHTYIGEMSQSIWHPVRKNFLEFFDPLKPYRCAVLNPSIGAGKLQDLDSNIAIDKFIVIELDNLIIKIPYDDNIEIVYNKIKKIIKAEELKHLDLEKVDLPEPIISKYSN